MGGYEYNASARVFLNRLATRPPGARNYLRRREAVCAVAAAAAARRRTTAESVLFMAVPAPCCSGRRGGSAGLRRVMGFWGRARCTTEGAFYLAAVSGAGGRFAVPGDYLYRNQTSFLFDGGMWGTFRVR